MLAEAKSGSRPETAFGEYVRRTRVGGQPDPLPLPASSADGVRYQRPSEFNSKKLPKVSSSSANLRKALAGNGSVDPFRSASVDPMSMSIGGKGAMINNLVKTPSLGDMRKSPSKAQLPRISVSHSVDQIPKLGGDLAIGTSKGREVPPTPLISGKRGPRMRGSSGSGHGPQVMSLDGPALMPFSGGPGSVARSTGGSKPTIGSIPEDIPMRKQLAKGDDEINQHQAALAKLMPSTVPTAKGGADFKTAHKRAKKSLREQAMKNLSSASPAPKLSPYDDPDGAGPDDGTKDEEWVSAEEYNSAVRQLKDKILQKGPFAVTLHFQNLDKDGSGFLEADEFKEAIELFNLKFSDSVTSKLLRVVDQDQSGAIDYREFTDALRMGRIGYMKQKYAEGTRQRSNPDPDLPFGNPHHIQPFGIMKDAEVNLRDYDRRIDAMFQSLEETFKEFDTDGSGEIDSTEFMKAMEMMNNKKDLKLSRQEMINLFKVADKDCSGEITYEEFLSSFSGGAGKRFIPEFLKPKATRCSQMGPPWKWDADPVGAHSIQKIGSREFTDVEGATKTVGLAEMQVHAADPRRLRPGQELRA